VEELEVGREKLVVSTRPTAELADECGRKMPAGTPALRNREIAGAGGGGAAAAGFDAQALDLLI